jgi:hypothetical protein
VAKDGLQLIEIADGRRPSAGATIVGWLDKGCGRLEGASRPMSEVGEGAQGREVWLRVKS